MVSEAMGAYIPQNPFSVVAELHSNRSNRPRWSISLDLDFYGNLGPRNRWIPLL